MRRLCGAQEDTGPEGAAHCLLGRRSHGGSCPLRLCPPTARRRRAAAPAPHAGGGPVTLHYPVPRGGQSEALGSASGLGTHAGDSR